MTSASPIPVIDMAPFYDGGKAEVSAVVDAVRRACEEIGFFLLRGHRVPPEVVARLGALSRAFFDYPQAEKSKVDDVGPLLGGLAYVPPKGENLAATRGAAVPPDLKECLDFGLGFKAAPWPERPGGLKAACHDYYAALSALAADIREIFALALGLPGGYFDDKFDRHLSSIRVLNYPEQLAPPEAGQIRAGAHTDYGAFTILRADAAPGGLQVKNRAGAWVDVPGAAEAFVVNIGDAFMRWTDDHWISTLHRVVNPPQEAAGPTRRQAIAFFHNPNADTVIECLPTFSAAASGKYPPIAYKDYAEIRFRQSHGAEKTLDLG